MEGRTESHSSQHDRPEKRRGTQESARTNHKHPHIPPVTLFFWRTHQPLLPPANSAILTIQSNYGSTEIPNPCILGTSGKIHEGHTKKCTSLTRQFSVQPSWQPKLTITTLYPNIFAISFKLDLSQYFFFFLEALAFAHTLNGLCIHPQWN